MKIIERIPAHYETQQVVQDLGRVYRWYPEQVVLECSGCGTRKTYERSELIAALVNCAECGAGCSARAREDLVIEQLAEEERIHPWRYWRSKEDAGIPI